MKRMILSLLVVCLCLVQVLSLQKTYANEDVQTENSAKEVPSINVDAKAAILMEASTGTVIYEKESNEQLKPASITKIMTLLLIFDALEEGKIKLEDMVTTSEHAASMGGSQVFLEVGEQQTVDTMIKCIAVASANDASVAMAEHVFGTEEEFVKKMNERAKGLGMNQTHFVNSCGLDADEHVTSAMDVALMSRELIVKYPKIHDYSTIWMENITHTTGKGTSEFGLANTNKMVKQYKYTTGLKTGSTSLAKYCVSATAKKDGVNLIAVIMAASDYKIRFADAASLLNYGFANCKVYEDTEMPEITSVKVEQSLTKEAVLKYKEDFRFLGMHGENFSEITKELQLPEAIQAPMKKGSKVGKLVYSINGNPIGQVDILLDEEISKAAYRDFFRKVCGLWMV